MIILIRIQQLKSWKIILSEHMQEQHLRIVHEWS